MSEIARRIAQASAHVEPTWSAEREARLKARVGRGLQRRQRQRTAMVVALGACTLLLGFFLGRQPGITARVAPKSADSVEVVRPNSGDAALPKMTRPASL